MVFIGFGIAAVHKFLTAACKLWADEPAQHLYRQRETASRSACKGAAISGDLSPGIARRRLSDRPAHRLLMMAGAVLSYFVIGPLIATFGENLTRTGVAGQPSSFRSAE